MEKQTRWFVEPHTPDTNTAIYEMKKAFGRHDQDFLPGTKVSSKAKTADLWEMNFPDIARILSDTSRGLKLTLYKQDASSDVIARWEQPKRDRNLKIVLPLFPMRGRVREAREEILQISRNHSTEQVSYSPDYVTHSLMMRNKDDIEQLRRGFATIMEMMMRGTYDQVALFGGDITEGMVRYILLAETLHIPVLAKTMGTKKALTELLGS